MKYCFPKLFLKMILFEIFFTEMHNKEVTFFFSREETTFTTSLQVTIAKFLFSMKIFKILNNKQKIQIKQMDCVMVLKIIIDVYLG